MKEHKGKLSRIECYSKLYNKLHIKYGQLNFKKTLNFPIKFEFLLLFIGGVGEVIPTITPRSVRCKQ